MLWLWHRLAAIAPIHPLAWEFPYATGVAIKGERKKEREREREKKKRKGKEKRGEERKGKSRTKKNEKDTKSHTFSATKSWLKIVTISSQLLSESSYLNP